MTTAAVPSTQLHVDDMITEVRTSEGPFHSVLKVNARSVVVDAREDGDNEPLPITLPVTGTRLVRRRT